MTASGELGRAAPSVDELELLRAALCPGNEAAGAWARWRSTYDVFHAPHRSHEIFPAVSANLDPAVLGADAHRLSGLRRNTWVNNQLALESLGAGLEVLADAGIEPIVVKGARLVACEYHKPGTRRMADVDVVVGPRCFDMALKELTSSGWAVKGNWAHAADLTGPSGTGLDLHRWILFPRFSRVPEDVWWERTESGFIAGRPAKRLSLPDELVLSVVHGLFTSSPSTVRWPLDVAAIVASLDSTSAEAFWMKVRASAQEIGLGPIVGKGLSMCTEEFGLYVPAATLVDLKGQRLDPLVAIHWRLHKTGAKPPMRVRRFVDLERAAGRRPSAANYARARWESLREHGPRRVLGYRIRNLSRTARRVAASRSGAR